MDTPLASSGHFDFSTAPESPVEGDLSRAVVTRRTAYDHGHRIKPHWHARAQFIFAVAGTMRVRTARRVWIVPPTRALWVPARTRIVPATAKMNWARACQCGLMRWPWS